MGVLLDLVPWWGRVVAVLALCGALTGYGFVKGIDHADAQHADFDRQLAEQAAAQVAKNAAIKAAGIKAKQENDNAHKDDVAKRPARNAATVAKLRDSPSPRAVSTTPATATSPAKSCYSTDRLNAGLANADAYLSQHGTEIVGRGQDAIEDLNLAKSWSLTVR